LPNDGVEVRPFAGFEFGMKEFAIGADFESAAARGHERERRNPLAEFKNFRRQTDGLRRVVSDHAILDSDFDFHGAPFSAGLSANLEKALDFWRENGDERLESARVFGIEAIELRAVEIEHA
jgi:hypothetical protein